MPNPLIKKYAAQAKCSVGHVEAEWEKAKEIAKSKFGNTESPKYWAYVNGITQRALKLKEGFKDFSENIELAMDVPAEVDTPVAVEPAPEAPVQAEMPPRQSSHVDSAALVSTLFGARDWAHALHLKTQSHAAHLALEELYNDLLDMTDKYAETAQGKHGILNILANQSLFVGMDEHEFVSKLAVWLEQQGRHLIEPSDTYLLNQFDEILAAVYRAKYKIDNLK